jgi:carboxymethylenebutenolidase
MDQKIINLYDEYIHSPTITRADFLKRVTLITGSIALTQSVLSQIENNYTKPGLTTAEDLFTEYINYPGVPNEMKAYIARPKTEKKYAAVIVIHENRGLNAHIEDVQEEQLLQATLQLPQMLYLHLEKHLPMRMRQGPLSVN